MAISLSSLLLIQFQLVTAYFLLNLALVSLTLSKSFSHIHSFLFMIRLFLPLVSRVLCVLAWIETKLARITMRIVSHAHGSLEAGERPAPAVLARDYGTDTEVFSAYVALMNAQNILFLSGVQYLLRVFFIIPLSLFHIEIATERRAQDKNENNSTLDQPVQSPAPTSETPVHQDPTPDNPSEDINSNDNSSDVINSSEGLNSNENLSATTSSPVSDETSLMALASSSDGVKMVHAAQKRREVFLWVLKRKYRVLKIYK